MFDRLDGFRGWVHLLDNEAVLVTSDIWRALDFENLTVFKGRFEVYHGDHISSWVVLYTESLLSSKTVPSSNRKNSYKKYGDLPFRCVSEEVGCIVVYQLTMITETLSWSKSSNQSSLTTNLPIDGSGEAKILMPDVEHISSATSTLTYTPSSEQSTPIVIWLTELLTVSTHYQLTCSNSSPLWLSKPRKET